MKIGILGTGTWGTALGRMLCNNGHDVVMWSALADEIRSLNTTRKHPNLPGAEIPDSLIFTDVIADACSGAEIIVAAVPSVFMRSSIRAAAPYISDGQTIVCVAKGIESSTLFTMTEVIADELKDVTADKTVRIAALSGPTHAEEVARDLPTTIVSACEDLDTARMIQDVFMNTCMRVYTNIDVKGVELCGALKNIIALAAGIGDGIGFGDNAKAALITRGIAEINRLGRAMGCDERTFFGLAGVGDLIVTATSVHSRNNRCGNMIGKGMAPEEAVKAVGMVVEGINALPAAMRLAEEYHVDMPIVSAVDRIINHGGEPRAIVSQLMSRRKKAETGDAAAVEYETALISNSKENDTRRVITYGSFDLLHYGHINFLRRAKALGDYLIVALSTDEFHKLKKNEDCYFTYEQRKRLIEALRYVDLVIPEETWEQKKSDLKMYHIDTFVIGESWRGEFDYLKEEGVEVIYLKRTPEISSSQIKDDLTRFGK